MQTPGGVAKDVPRAGKVKTLVRKGTSRRNSKSLNLEPLEPGGKQNSTVKGHISKSRMSSRSTDLIQLNELSTHGLEVGSITKKTG